MRASPAITMGVAAALFAFPAHAQVGSAGISGGSTSSGVGASGGVGSIGGTTTSGIGVDGSSDSSAARATEGDSSINSLNVDDLARSGTAGSAVTTLGGDGDFQSTAGSGSPQAYRIPTPTVAVDLGAIRRGLAAGPSATPKLNGD